MRKLTLDEAEPLQEIFFDHQVMQFSVRGILDGSGIEQHIKENIKKYSQSHFCRWADVEKLSSNVIGVCGLNKDTVNFKDIVHLNYRFSKENWGLGFATELVKALVEYSGSVGLNKIHALIEPANSASINVVEKSGFKLQGTVLYKGTHAHMFSIDAQA